MFCRLEILVFLSFSFLNKFGYTVALLKIFLHLYFELCSPILEKTFIFYCITIYCIFYWYLYNIYVKIFSLGISHKLAMLFSIGKIITVLPYTYRSYFLQNMEPDNFQSPLNLLSLSDRSGMTIRIPGGVIRIETDCSGITIRIPGVWSLELNLITL